jgi:DME family drug/metabolite transporter
VQELSSTNDVEGSSLGYLLTLGAGASFSSTAILSTLLSSMGVPSIEQALFRASVTALFFGLILLLKPSIRRVRRRDLKFFVLNGLFGVALSISAYLSSIALGTPVAVAVTLSYLQPMFSVIFANLFLHERVTITKVVAVISSILGASIVSGLWQIFGAPTSIPAVGAVLAAMNGFFYAVYIIIGRISGSDKSYHFATTMFYSFLFASIWMGPIWLLMSSTIDNPIVSGFVLDLTQTAFAYLLMLAFVGTILPYGLLAMGLRKVKASRAGVILLIEPVSVMVLGVLILGQTLTPWGIVGAALILGATIIVSLEAKVAKVLTDKRKS